MPLSRRKGNRVGSSLNAVPDQIGSAIALLRHPRARALAIVSVVVTLLATWCAPGDHGFLDWSRIVVIVVTAALAVLLLADDRPGHTDDRPRLLGSLFFILVAVVFNLTFGVATAIAYSIAFSLLAAAALRLRGAPSTWLTAVLVTIAVPPWIWIALDVWDNGLLLLLPLAALAIVSSGHRRFAVRRSGGPATISGRAHRLASWLAALIAAGITLVAGVTTDASNTWVAIGALATIVCLGLEAGLASTVIASNDDRARLVDLAFGCIALAWMIGL